MRCSRRPGRWMLCSCLTRQSRCLAAAQTTCPARQTGAGLEFQVCQSVSQGPCPLPDHALLSLHCIVMSMPDGALPWVPTPTCPTLHVCPDRYAAMDVGVLLHHLENHIGIVVLITNKVAACLTAPACDIHCFVVRLACRTLWLFIASQRAHACIRYVS